MENYFPNKYKEANKSHLASFDILAPLFPVGITLHYTAGVGLQSIISSLREKKLGYHLIITKDGVAYQCSEFNFKLNHAGKAMWNHSSPNQSHIAVALESWGWVTQLTSGSFHSWSGKDLNVSDLRFKNGKWWDAATKPQEDSLLEFLRWALENGIEAENICGHDEAAIPKGRKEDPGGTLTVDTPTLRKILSVKKGIDNV